MADWTKSMEQTFEFYEVDPTSWRDLRLLNTVKSCTINRDSEAETLGSATIDITESTGECYIRAYLITLQNGVKEKHPLGTFLVQTPALGFDGKIRSVSMDAYTPLLELKENPPPLGYNLSKQTNIMDTVYRLSRENMRAPVSTTDSSKTLYRDFVADTNDTWLSFLIDLAAKADYTFALDELGRVMFAPKQDIASLQPVWTFNDDNSSILYPDLNVNYDLYGVPNVVEVRHKGEIITIINDDPDSPTSTVSRGRRITHRVIDPDMDVIVGLTETDVEINGDPTRKQLEEYATRLLRELSTIECTISYTHGYCPVRLGDCVRLNYTRAGITGVKAKVVNQSIKCEPGCPVTEKAVFTTKLWR